MNWNFSLGWFFFGLLLLAGGVAMVIYYKQISDNFVHGISSYEHVKLAGVIVSIVSLIVMANLHTLILTLLANLIFKR